VEQPAEGPELSVVVVSVVSMVELSESSVAAQGFLGGAVFARVLTGHLQAVELEQLAGYARVSEGDEFAHLEVATLLHISDGAARARLRFAVELTTRLPATLAALRHGEIEEFKARLIADAVACLSDEHALAVEGRVVARAGEQTPGQLRNALARAVLAVDPVGAEERRRERVLDRRVESQPTCDGQAMLTIHHSAEKIVALHGVITARARQLKALGGETRTLAHLEADVACDLYLGNCQVEVHLTIPATTAVGFDDQPAEVDGLPVTAHSARELMAEASSWRWIRTDPATGVMVDLTYPRYAPPAVLAELVRVRDRTCRFPGCVRRARRCDVDHRTPWPAGATSAENCACLCRRHHRAKHDGGWHLTQLRPGWYQWASPLGFSHTVSPELVADPDPPPF
jgi:hypothetical protein